MKLKADIILEWVWIGIGTAFFILAIVKGFDYDLNTGLLLSLFGFGCFIRSDIIGMRGLIVNAKTKN